MNEHISNKDESVVRESIEESMKEGLKESSRVEIPLYEHRKGKAFHASGSWQATKGEIRLIMTFGYMFFFGVFLGLILQFVHPGKLASILVGIGIIGAVGTFISLFAIVIRKHKQEPMEGHYYDIDYKYNAFSGEKMDNTKEITKEEFYGKK